MKYHINMIKAKKTSSNKVLVIISLVAILLLGIVTAVVTVFALNNKGINSNVKISFNAVDIEGKVELYSTLKTGTEVKLGETEFTPTKTAGNINVDAVELDATDDYITFKYKFYNYGSRSYSALLRYLDYPTSENIEVSYSQNDSEYLKSKSIIIVNGKTVTEGTNEYFVRVKVADLAFDANFEGDFSWLLEKYTGDQEFSLGAVDYIYDSNTDTYTAAYNGAALENNTLYVASKVGSANVTTVGKMATLPANTTVVLEEGITEIDRDAFSGNNGLVAIEVPATLETIDMFAFRDCANLTSITFPEDSNLKTINGYAFFSSSIEDVVLPDNVENLGSMVFYNSNLTNFTIPASVTEIGSGAFSGCSNLTTINIEEGNTCFEMRGNCLIEKSTGRLIKGFDDSVIPDDGTIKNIDNYSLMSTKLTITYLPEGITRIGDYAFHACYYITELKLPSTLEEIGSWGLNITNLKTITIPKSVTKIYDSVFSCNLESLTLEDGIANYKMQGNCLIEISTGKLLKGFADSVIPTDGTVKIIEQYAFAALNFTNIVIPASVTQINSNAFAECTSLQKVTIENNSNLKYIYPNVFTKCHSLTEIDFGNNTTGWFYSTSSTATSGTTLSSLDLDNNSTAATYLKTTYSKFYWKRII